MSEKSRNFALILYSEDQINKGLIEYAEKIKNYAYILHKGEGSDENTKKDHFHMILKLRNAFLSSTVSKWFTTDKDRALAIVVDRPKNYFQYMLHQTEKSIEDGKIKYDVSDVKSDNVDYWTGEEVDQLQQAVFDMLDGMTVRELVTKYGRDFIIHYSSIKDVVKAISNQEIDKGA